MDRTRRMHVVPTLAMALIVASSASAQQVVRWSAHFEATTTFTPGSPAELVLEATIEPGWKLYALTQEPGGPQALVFAAAPGSVLSLDGPPVGPLPFVAADPNFSVETHSHTEAATFYVPLLVPGGSNGSVTGTLTISYQTCTDKFCLPPVTDQVAIAIPVAGQGRDATVTIVSGAPRQGAGTANVEDMAAATSASTLGAYLALAALMGALSLLTPCVFPMVPITVSYFTSRAERRRAAAVGDALVYGLGIVLTFTAVGLVIALGFGAGGLNQFASHPWLNLAIAGLFVAFALNLFGVFDLTLPSTWLTRLSLADQGRGRVIGTMLMGLAFTLTSFTCTAPFLGTLLVVASQGSWQWPLAGLLAFSTVFALPFVVLAWLPHRLSGLPRSGRWLHSVKVGMGFLELAAAFKFLSNADLVWEWGLFSRSVVLSSWIVIGLALTAYIVGLRRGKDSSRAPRTGPIHVALSVSTFLMTMWLGSGLSGRRLGELEAFLPPADLRGGHGELSWLVNDYDEALRTARAAGQPVLIDFTGYTCTNCRWMEANVFTDPAVVRELSRYVRVRLYTDGLGDLHRRYQQMQSEMFGTVALPYYVALSPTGAPTVAFGGLTRDRALFVSFLQRGLRPWTVR